MAQEFNVFVTGFGPFPNGKKGQYEKNASHEITKLLPSNATTTSATGQIRINIVNPTSKEGAYVKTEYKYVRDYIKRLHNDTADKIDLYLHIGMAAGTDDVIVESRAYRQDFTSTWSSKDWRSRGGSYYRILDNVGQTVEDAGECPWMKLPIGLHPSIDVEQVTASAKAALDSKYLLEKPRRLDGEGARKVIDVRSHADPGGYCCGFIFYESLANRYIKGKDANVMFCHVPAHVDRENLERARDGIVAVITAAASQMVNEQRGVDDKRPVLNTSFDG